MLKKTVLIVDDDDSFVRVLTVRCRNLGLAVRTAHNGVEARQQIQKARPDLVLLDVNMPGGNAFDVCRMMASQKHLNRIPVIILTGDSAAAHMDASRHYGAFYVPKTPYMWSSVKPMIQSWFGNTKAA